MIFVSDGAVSRCRDRDERVKRLGAKLTLHVNSEVFVFLDPILESCKHMSQTALPPQHYKYEQSIEAKDCTVVYKYKSHHVCTVILTTLKHIITRKTSCVKVVSCYQQLNVSFLKIFHREMCLTDV